MDKNVIIKVRDYYQEKYNLKERAIFDGICGASTFSKTKVNDTDMDFLMVETLLARVGKDVEEFEFLASDDDYDLWVERLAIKAAMCDNDMEQVEKRIAYYQEVMPQHQKLHRQFCLDYQIKLAEWKREKVEVVCEMAQKALALTKKVEKMPHRQQNLYTPMEMDLLLTLVHYRYGEWEKSYKVEACLWSIIEYIGVYYAVERLEVIEGRAWMELLKLSEERNDVKELLSYIDKAIECLAKGTGIIKLAQVHFMKAKLLARMRTGSGDQHWQKMCMEECKMAYCIYSVMERKEQAEDIEKFCREELEWHITI